MAVLENVHGLGRVRGKVTRALRRCGEIRDFLAEHSAAHAYHAFSAGALVSMHGSPAGALDDPVLSGALHFETVRYTIQFCFGKTTPGGSNQQQQPRSVLLPKYVKRDRRGVQVARETKFQADLDKTLKKMSKPATCG